MDIRTLKVALMLLLIFVAGGFCGWWMGRSGADTETSAAPRGGGRPPVVRKDQLLNEFTTDLGLTPEQRLDTEEILGEWAQEAQRVHRENLRGRYALFQKYSPIVRTNFTAEQKRIYDRKTAETERRWRRMMQNP